MYKQYIKLCYRSHKRKTKQKQISKPKYIDCNCIVEQWTVYHEDNNEIKIDNHMYGHVMELFIPKVLCNIVKYYVGDSPSVYRIVDNNPSSRITNYTSVHKFCTLGFVCLDEGKDDNENFKCHRYRCRIKGCVWSLHNKSWIYCDHHFNESIRNSV
jgi:hypothetical protein